MVILALDTSTRAGSIALARDVDVVASAVGDVTRTHGERLPGDIIRLLTAHDVALAEVDVFAVASGPGSFTSLRVGIATIQALALAHQRSVVPISALEALARTVTAPRSGLVPVTDLVAAWMDGHRRDVFAALYERTASELRAVAGPVVGGATDVIDGWQAHLAGRTVCFVGDTVVATRSLLAERLGSAAVLEPDVPPLAPIMARMAAALARRGETVAPHAVRPLYVRRPDAELARARRRESAHDGPATR